MSSTIWIEAEGMPVYFYGLIYIGIIMMWVYFLFCMIQVTSAYHQHKKAEISKISVFRTIGKKTFFQYVWMTVLVGIPYLAINYLLLGTFDIESTPDEDIFTSLGILILCAIGTIACLIRLVFSFFILLDRRNFGPIGIWASLKKSLELTRGKYISVFFGFVFSLGVFFILDMCFEVLLEGQIVWLPLWKLIYIVCFNGVSCIILTSIYNTLLQANGLISLSQTNEVSRWNDTQPHLPETANI